MKTTVYIVFKIIYSSTENDSLCILALYHNKEDAINLIKKLNSNKDQYENIKYYYDIYTVI